MSEFISALNGYTDNPVSSPQSGLGGHSDWRLPTAEELFSIVDLSAPGCHSGSPCIDPVFGPTQADFYWSSTTWTGDPVGAFLVDFEDGMAYPAEKTSYDFVRAVRGGL